MSALHNFMFGYYPYICLTVFFLGSLLRFDRDQYTWKSDSSQMLRAGTLRWGSNLFHIGVLFLFFGHFAGLLTPHFIYEHFISASDKQMVAIVSGGTAGLLCFIGLTLLLYRRLFDPRIRATSKPMDIVILVILWLQLTLGLLSLPVSLHHSDGSAMMALGEWAQRIVTFRPDAAVHIIAVEWVFKAHLIMGMTIFLLFPFTRLVHVWSGFAAASYFVRPYQVVRSRRLNLSVGHNLPPKPNSGA